MEALIITKLSGLLLIILALENIKPSAAKREIKIVETFLNTSDPSLMDGNIDLSTDESGTHSLNGNFFVSQDVLNDDLKADCSIYSSEDKDDVERQEIFSLSNLKALDFVNHFYRAHFMKLLEECSNAPQFEEVLETYEGLGNNYIFKDCTFKDFKFVHILLPGYYTAICHVSRKEMPALDASFSLSFIIENNK